MKRSGVRPAIREKAWLRCGVLLLFIVLCGSAMACSAAPVPAGGIVAAVLDGDTVVLNSGQKVRYLGIDAPEIAHETRPAACYGEQAKRANARWVLHKRVTLEYEKTARDRYGRLLAYVFLPDGRCVNALLLQAGQAYVYRTAEPFRRWERFLTLQRHAIATRAGLWGACRTRPAPHYVGNRHSFVVHRPQCRFGQHVSHRHRVTFATRWAAFRAGYRPCRRCKP